MTARAVRRVAGTTIRPAELDAIAVEEPLEIRLGGRPLAVTMRTPGLEKEMVLGFLFAEGLITGPADVALSPGRGGNVFRAKLLKRSASGRRRTAMTRRGTLTTSACGVCGRLTIDDLLARIGTARRAPQVPIAAIHGAPDVLRESQASFDQTGGLHAAGALDRQGRLLFAAEDIGRHNAVDKVVGLLLASARLDEAAILAVSGRASFEILQKAAAARIPVVAAVGAPSSLAIDLAEGAGICLAAFVRGKKFNVYTHAERLVGGGG
ncbi:MAG: formate dehydrogenase accessory sulfurtransferase FdhD [Planctomycetes bacterium]|nr:formate dehydrogenase accessory sulfurtransferase FdhD [Planctomycetota bacterium]